MLEKVSQIHKTYLLDQQLFCRRHFYKTEVVQNTDLNILALKKQFRFKYENFAPELISSHYAEDLEFHSTQDQHDHITEM
jgi:hypothetical protein